MNRSVAPRALSVVFSALALSACYDGLDPEDWASSTLGEDTMGDTSGSGGEGGSASQGTGDPSTSGDPDTSGGDGDGDPDTTTGNGDGDPPDPTTTGNGDGDGDPPDPTTTGNGDGDGDPPDPTTTGDPTTGGGDEGLPDNNYCNPVSNWSDEWIQLELEVIELVNAARAQGGDCDSQGVFPPSGPLTWEPALTCAARVHSKDMADNNFFDHTNLGGNGPGWRMDQAGFNGGTWGENIAAGYGSPQQVVQGWLDSDGHCSNMLNGDFSLIGVGYAYGNGDYGHYWTQNFGG